jgi:uncharacterized protein involved in exopolysaccharide biosynthesis
MSLSTLPPEQAIGPLRDVPMAGEPVPVVSLQDIVRTVFRHALPIVLIMVVALVGAVGYLLYESPTYTAQSKLLVRVGREKLAPLTVGVAPTTNYVFGERVENVNDEIEILRNPNIMAQVFPQLKQRYEELLAASRDRPPPVSLLDWVRYYTRTVKQAVSDGVHWTMDMLHEPLYFLGLSQRMTEDEMLFAAMEASLDVEFVKETNIVILGFSWADPNFAAYALNTFVTAYRREQMRVLGDTAGAVEFYQGEQARSEAALSAMNRQIDAFLADSGVSDPLSEKQLAMTLIGALERQKSDAEVAERQTLGQLAAYQKQFSDSNDWPETPAAPGVTLTGLTDIDARHTELLTRRNTALQTWVPGSPQVRQLDSEIAALRRAKLASLTSYLNDRLAAERDEQHVVAARMEEQRARLDRLNGIASHYAGLVDQRDQIVAQLKTYRTQIEQLGINQALNDRGFASVTVLNAAVAPDHPSAPRKGLILGLAAGFGLLFAAGFVIVSEFFDRSFAGERDVMRVLGLRVVASVPQLDRASQRRQRR